MNHARMTQALRRMGVVLLAAALGLLCAFALAACGSTSSAAPPTSSTTASSTTTTTGAAGGSASFTAFRTCLTQHGATLPQGGGFGRRGAGGAAGGGQPGAGAGARPTPSPALQKALAACASLRPSGGFGGAGRPGRAGANANNPAFAKFQSCLKSHGVNAGSAGKSSASAIAACRSVLPNGGNASAAGSTSTTTTTAGP
jgi:hypothetical protein